jgi:transaldolase
MNPLQKLAALGQSPWLDFISRRSIRGGQIASLVDQGILGVTSNPAIFEHAINGSADYDEDIQKLAAQGLSPFEIYDRISIQDVGEAADLLRAVYDRTGGVDGYVSLEVRPELARDTEGTIAEARRLWKALDRPNVMIKIPATAEGIPAIRQAIADGININVTLLFSLERYRETALAYLDGLEQTSRIDVASVASFFVSRIDTMVDAQLPPELEGEAAIAWSQASYAIFQQVFSGPRWEALAAKGARVQRLLWASTSVKNPDYSPVKYCEALAGPDTVNTMPLATIEAYLKMGEPRNSLATVDPSTVLTGVKAAGVDLEAAAIKLEDEGITKFVQPFEKLLKSIEDKAALLAKA